MSDFGWNYPPGVSGNEPQITGEWPCAACGAILREEYDCRECEGGVVTETEAGRWVCGDCGHDAGENSECPEGYCVPDEPDPDRLRDEQLDRQQDDRYDR